MKRAACLDGEHVWITLDAPSAGRIVAAGRGSEDRVEFSPPVAVGVQTVLLPVAELPGEDERSWTLRFAAGGREIPLSRLPQAEPPTLPVPSPDARWVHRVSPGGEGLELQRVATEPAATVQRIAADDRCMTVEWEAAEGTAAVLLDGVDVVAELPVTVHDGRAVAEVTTDPVMPIDTVLPVAVRHGDGTIALRRKQNDLRWPNASVQLPELALEDRRVRLAWSGHGLLQVVWREPR